MKNLIPIFLTMSLFACSKTDKAINTFMDCEMVTEDYKIYQGEEIDCQYHYVLTEYNGQQYIELLAHCADLIRPFVINENCEDICERLPNVVNSECNDYLNNRAVIEILLIHK